MYSLLIADDNQQWCESVKAALEKEKAYEPIYVTNDGKATLTCLHHYKPDILLLDVMMPHYDGIFLLRNIRNYMKAYQPIVYVLSGLDTEHTISSFNQLKIDFFSLKPIDPSTIISNLKYITEQRLLTEQAAYAEDRPRQIAHLVENVFYQLRIPLRLMSTQHAMQAAELCIKDPTYLRMATKMLYPTIARLNHTNISCIERNIRTTIVKMQESDAPFYRELFADYLDRKMSNGLFLEVIVFYINNLLYEQESKKLRQRQKV